MIRYIVNYPRRKVQQLIIRANEPIKGVNYI